MPVQISPLLALHISLTTSARDTSLGKEGFRACSSLLALLNPALPFAQVHFALLLTARNCWAPGESRVLSLMNANSGFIL